MAIWLRSEFLVSIHRKDGREGQTSHDVRKMKPRRYFATSQPQLWGAQRLLQCPCRWVEMFRTPIKMSCFFLSKLVPVMITRWKSLRLTLCPVAENRQQCEGKAQWVSHYMFAITRAVNNTRHIIRITILTSARVLNPGIIKLEIWPSSFFLLQFLFLISPS